MQRDEKWFSTIKWDDSCLVCQSKTNGICASYSCAKKAYDPWGDPYPCCLFHDDTNEVDRYIDEKKKLMQNIK